MTPREELNLLLDAAMRKALRLVQEQGSHMPFAVAVTTNGEQVDIAGDDREVADPQARHAWITQQVSAAVAAGQYRAVAVVRNIELTHNKTGKQADAVEVTLDHVDDQPVTCYMPYELRRGRLNTAEIVATAPSASFFARK
jgi:hypothetical protein